MPALFEDEVIALNRQTIWPYKGRMKKNLPNPDLHGELHEELCLAEQLLAQKRQDKKEIGRLFAFKQGEGMIISFTG
jgi:hypothetical protein